MKLKNSTLLTGLSILVCVSFMSCKKADKPQQQIVSEFNWTFKGVNYTAAFDTANLSSNGTPSIYAGNGPSIPNPNSTISFNLPSFNLNTYTFGGGGSAILIYFDTESVSILRAASGSITITTNSNNLLSGNFSATLVNTAGTMTSTINGIFKNVTIVP